MRSRIMCCRAGTLRAVILRTTIGKFDLGLGAPASTGEMIKVVVENHASRTANPDVKVDVGKAAVASGASFIGE